MSKRKLSTLHGFLFCFLSVVFCPAPLSAAGLSVEEEAWLAGRDEIVVTCDDAYAPFEFRNADGDLDGMVIELIRWIATEYGFKVRFLPLSLVEEQQAVLNRQADILSFLFYSEARDRQFDFTENVFQIPATIFTRADRPDVRAPGDLSRLTVGLPEGDFAAEYLERNNFKGNIVYSSSLTLVVENLLQGRVDAIIADEQVVLYQLYQSGNIAEVKRLERPLYVGDARMVVAEGNHVLRGILNKGIIRAREQGIIDGISRKWLGVTYGRGSQQIVPYGVILGAGGVLAILLLLAWLWNLQLKRRIVQHTRELQLANEKLQTDIAARRMAEQAMVASEERYRVLLARLPDIVLVHDKGVIVFANEASVSISGIPAAELPGHHVMEYMYSGDRQIVLDRLEDDTVLQDAMYELRLNNARGEICSFEVRASIITYNERLMTMVVMTDVTARIKAEEDLRESEEKFRSTVELLPVGIYEFDLQGRFRYANGVALAMFGYEPGSDVSAISVSEVIVTSERAKAARNIEHVLRTNTPMNFLYTGLRRDGSTFPLEIHSSVVFRKGQPAGLRGVLIDVTEKKRAEDEYLRTNKLESVGLLAGGIAHDFNNILTAIMGNVHLAAALLEDHDAVTYLREADRACLRARDLTYQLLTFSKGGEPVVENARIEEIIRESTGFALRGSPVDAVFDIATDLWPASVDKGQFSRVIHNIVINAVQAMPDGGQISISAANIILEDSDTQKLPSGRYVRIAISDNGPGIPPDHVDRIFDPYFSTRKKGSGLGLAIVYSIIRKHDGSVSLDSTPGQGATFTILLPAADHPFEKPETIHNNPEQKFNLRVLMMDDEQMVLDVAAGYLTHLGCEVVCVPDSDAAEERFREALAANRPFDLVILDLTVPGKKDGLQTFLGLQALFSDVVAVVTSGYADGPVLARAEETGFKGILRKPFTLDDIRELLRRLFPDHKNKE